MGVYAYDVTVTADHSLYEVLEPWDEPPFSPTGEVSAVWEVFPLTEPDAAASLTATAETPAWLLWDVTSLVSSWIDASSANNGVVIATEDGAIVFWTSEHEVNPALRPYLQINYTPEPSMLSMLALGGLAVLRRRSPGQRRLRRPKRRLE
jgi:hypothetical protein